MTIESKQEGQAPTTDAPASAHERCAGCGAALAEDQRYCLQCGARRGRPRLDFTAFWKPQSPTGAQAGNTQAGNRAQAPSGTWARRTPPRRVIGALAAAVLAAGIVAGAALGPTPASSPADTATLAERALTALATQASGGAQAGAPSPPAPAPGASQTSLPSTTRHKTTTPKTSSAQASTPSSSQSSSPSESSESTPSESSSPESSSSKGPSKSEKAPPGTPVKLPPVKHVWLIALSGTSFASALAQAQADPYLAKQLVPKGELLSDYTLTAPS